MLWIESLLFKVMSEINNKMKKKTCMNWIPLKRDWFIKLIIFIIILFSKY